MPALTEIFGDDSVLQFGLDASVSPFSSGMADREKDDSPSRTVGISARIQSLSISDAGNNTDAKSSATGREVRIPTADYGNPSSASESNRFVPETSAPFSSDNKFSETDLVRNISPSSQVNVESAGDVWLSVSEVPLLTQPAAAPPPSRAPPPRPAQFSKTACGSVISRFEKKNDSYPTCSSSNAARIQQERGERFTLDAQERYSRERQLRIAEEERRQKEKEESRRIREVVKIEKEQRKLDKMAMREAHERAAAEAIAKAERAAEARAEAERAAEARAQAEARERAERVVKRVQAEVHERALRNTKEEAEKGAIEAKERARAQAREKEAQEKTATAARANDDTLGSFGIGSHASSTPRELLKHSILREGDGLQEKRKICAFFYQHYKMFCGPSVVGSQFSQQI